MEATVIGDFLNRDIVKKSAILKDDVMIAFFALLPEFAKVKLLHFAVRAIGRAVDDDFIDFPHRAMGFENWIYKTSRSC